MHILCIFLHITAYSLHISARSIPASQIPGCSCTIPASTTKQVHVHSLLLASSCWFVLVWRPLGAAQICPQARPTRLQPDRKIRQEKSLSKFWQEFCKCADLKFQAYHRDVCHLPWSDETFWPELASPWNGHHSKHLKVDKPTRGLSFAGLPFPFHECWLQRIAYSAN